MILCCGEALMDMLPEGEVIRPLPGGAVFNTALALGRLGAEVGYLWPLSTDAFGARLRGLLTDAGVDLTVAPASARPTTLAFVSLQDGEARYSFYDEGSAARDFAAAPPLPDAVRILFIGGISLVPDPTGPAIEAMVAGAGDRLVMLDANIRPAFIPDMAAHRARILRLAACAGVVKLSADDAGALWPGASQHEAAAHLLAAGAGLVLATRGAGGVEAIRAGGHAPLHHPAPRVRVVDSIGAGDAFNAGVLASLQAQGLDSHAAIASAPDAAIATALDHGSRIAAISLTRAGANPPWAHEL